MDTPYESPSFARSSVNLEADTSGCPIEFLPALIRKRAYELYDERGRQPGRELDDWLQAERELRHHFNL